MSETTVYECDECGIRHNDTSDMLYERNTICVCKDCITPKAAMEVALVDLGANYQSDSIGARCLRAVLGLPEED